MLLLRKCAINEASRQCYVKILSFGMTTERCAKATSKVVFVELKLAQSEVIKLCLLRCLRTSPQPLVVRLVEWLFINSSNSSPQPFHAHHDEGEIKQFSCNFNCASQLMSESDFACFIWTSSTPCIIHKRTLVQLLKFCFQKAIHECELEKNCVAWWCAMLEKKI